MGGYRHERIAEMVHREVAQRLRTEIKDPRMVPLSITHVDVNRDLSRAIISFCPLGGGGVSAELRACVDDVARGLRGPIGRALRLRHAPELVFTYDTHTDRALMLSDLLYKTQRERELRDGVVAEPDAASDEQDEVSDEQDEVSDEQDDVSEEA